MDKAIEAAALAVWARRHPSGRVSLPNDGALRDAVYADVEAAIAAYRAASGEARDAKRYRHFRLNFGLAVWGEDGQIAWHEEEIDRLIDADIDAAIAAREGESDE